jgi:putative ABC transport system ATP-binding protein
LNPILRITDLHKIYQKGSLPIPALRGVSFDVQKGEFLSIVGKSGCGKSTLLNLIGGLDSASSGVIYVRGKDLTKAKRYELALHRRKTVGMVFQSFNLISSRTAAENVELALAFGNIRRKERKEISRELLLSLGLINRLDHYPHELSGGEAQRVAIARALANQPAILLADEPTGNLDSGTSVEILDLLKKLNRERELTIMMVTHDEASAKSVSSRTLQFLDGQIIHQTALSRPL